MKTFEFDIENNPGIILKNILYPISYYFYLHKFVAYFIF